MSSITLALLAEIEPDLRVLAVTFSQNEYRFRLKKHPAEFGLIASGTHHSVRGSIHCADGLVTACRGYGRRSAAVAAYCNRYLVWNRLTYSEPAGPFKLLGHASYSGDPDRGGYRLPDLASRS
jgi:hypothetical protein